MGIAIGPDMTEREGIAIGIKGYNAVHLLPLFHANGEVEGASIVRVFLEVIRRRLLADFTDS